MLKQNKLNIFPLNGVILMPKTILPVPIDELSMDVSKAFDLKDTGELIGIVQSIPHFFENTKTKNNLTALEQSFRVGCAATILDVTRFESSGELMVIFQGICRFKMIKPLSHQDELQKDADIQEVLLESAPFSSLNISDEEFFASDCFYGGEPFRNYSLVDYSTFLSDIDADKKEPRIKGALKKKFMTAAHRYLSSLDITVSLSDMYKIPLDNLIQATTISGQFEPSERQAVLESQSIQDRLNLLTQLCHIGSLEHNKKSHCYH